MQDGRIHYVTFTSSSTVDNFFQLIAPEKLQPHVQKQVRLACIGPITARTLQGYGFTAHIQPGEYTIPALARALAEDAGSC
jgi:uroporphyrinogen III methyltransferase/synthase